jgi:LytS/YehU family sensor histidine kinase
MELFGGGIVQFLLIYFSSILMKVNVRMDEMHEEKTQAELSYLKAQINPHFLFNTLNSLYALTLEKSDGAPEAVLKLSGIMRYVVSESEQDFVALSKEIQYIKDYIDLQKLRISDNVQFSMQVEGSPDGKRIAPMLLIPFIENAFKYGVNPDEDSVIDIRFVLSDYQLHLTVLNTIAANSFDEQHKTGTGIENVQKRLNLVYPQKHKLQFATQADGMYLVDLKIFLES